MHSKTTHSRCESSRSRATIVSTQPAESFAARNPASDSTDLVAGLEEFVAKPLMIPLGMVVVETRGDSALQ